MRLWCITAGFFIFGVLLVSWIDIAIKVAAKPEIAGLPNMNYLLCGISFALIAYGIFK